MRRDLQGLATKLRSLAEVLESRDYDLVEVEAELSFMADQVNDLIEGGQ
jgi:hypothetical protein